MGDELATYYFENDIVFEKTKRIILWSESPLCVYELSHFEKSYQTHEMAENSLFYNTDTLLKYYGPNTNSNDCDVYMTVLTLILSS